MRYRYLHSIAASALLVAATAPAWGQSAACAALIAQGIRDTSSQHISLSRFNEIKSNVCNSNYDTYVKATQQAINGGFDVPGTFGISAGSSSASSDYSEKWSNLCQANYYKATENADLSSFAATANQMILHSFDNCVKITSEQFVRYVEPQPDGTGFAIVFKNKKEGTTSFTLDKLTLTDTTTGTVLNVKDQCDFTDSLPFDTKPNNVFSIFCRKDKGHTIVVNGITSAGNIDPVAVPAVPDPGPTIADRVATLEGLTQRLDQESLTIPPRFAVQSKQIRDVTVAEQQLSQRANKLCYVYSPTFVRTFVPLGENATFDQCKNWAAYLLDTDQHGLGDTARHYAMACEMPDGTINLGADKSASPPNGCGWN